MITLSAPRDTSLSRPEIVTLSGADWPVAEETFA